MFDSRAERGGMRVFSPKGASVILLVGALVVVGSLQLGRPTGHVVSDPMSFWEAAGRGRLTPAGGEGREAGAGPQVPTPGGGRPPDRGRGPRPGPAADALVGAPPPPGRPPAPPRPP